MFPNPMLINRVSIAVPPGPDGAAARRGLDYSTF